MITKVETRATTFFLLIKIEFRKYEHFVRSLFHDILDKVDQLEVDFYRDLFLQWTA